MQGAIFHQANVNLTVFPRVHGQTLSCTAMPQAGYFCHEVFPHIVPCIKHSCVVPWVTHGQGFKHFTASGKFPIFILEEESDATIWKISHASSRAWKQERLQYRAQQPCFFIEVNHGKAIYGVWGYLAQHVGHIICAHVIFQQTHSESNYIGQLGFKPSHMLANRADLDVYVWAQVGKGLAKLKTAQNIAIISHLEKYVHTVTFKKICSKMRLFSESARLPKKCTKHPKRHIYLYHWAVQVYTYGGVLKGVGHPNHPNFIIFSIDTGDLGTISGRFIQAQRLQGKSSAFRCKGAVINRCIISDRMIPHDIPIQYISISNYIPSIYHFLSVNNPFRVFAG